MSSEDKQKFVKCELTVTEDVHTKAEVLEDILEETDEEQNKVNFAKALKAIQSLPPNGAA
jgi:hypothetical protein